MANFNNPNQKKDQPQDKINQGGRTGGLGGGQQQKEQDKTSQGGRTGGLGGVGGAQKGFDDKGKTTK